MQLSRLEDEAWSAVRYRYRCEATSLGGFLQQLAVCYVGRGYWFYVTGFVPLGKNLRGGLIGSPSGRRDKDEVDRKLIGKYGIDISKWARARKKRAGMASVQYLRFRRFFVLIATQGRHRFFTDEAPNIHDVRKSPITFSGYSVSCRQGRPHVRIEREEYLRKKAYFIEIARKHTAAQILAELASLPFEPYAPVRSQLLVFLRAINLARKQAGLSAISRFSVRLKRRIYRPFEPVLGDDDDHPLKTGTG